MATRPHYNHGPYGGYGGDWKGGDDSYWAADDRELDTLSVFGDGEVVHAIEATTRSDMGLADPPGYSDSIILGDVSYPNSLGSASLISGHYFVRIEGQINDNTPMLIRSFTIFDDTGINKWQFGVWRPDGVIPFEVQCPPGYEIAGFYGRTGTALDALGIYMRLRKGATPGGGNAGRNIRG